MAEYQFVSTWQLAAPATVVFEALARPDDWFAHWRWFSTAERVATGSEHGVGGQAHFVVHSPLPYSLAFDVERLDASPPHRLDERVHGDLEGTGRWELTESDGVTRVRHTWRVRTTKRWMNAAAPVARPAFVWAHRVVMRDGARALSQGLGVGLLSVDSRTRPVSGGRRARR